MTDKQIENFWRDGAVHLPAVLDVDSLRLLAEGVELSMNNQSKFGETLRHPGDSGSFFNDYFQWRNIPQYQAIIKDSNLACLAAKLMKSQKSIFYHDHTLVKDAGVTTRTPWHHDQSYYPVNGKQLISFWIPLDNIQRETSLQFVQGSHAWGKKFIPRKFEDQRNYGTRKQSLDSDFPGQPNESIDKNAFDSLMNEFESLEVPKDESEWNILQWECSPGDIVAFHGWTLHGGSPSPASKRRVVSLRWFGDDCVFALRPWIPSPPFTGNLQEGQAMSNSPLFPIMHVRT